MSYKIIATDYFSKQLKRLAKKYPSLTTEFNELIAEIEQDPQSGTPLGNNCYKIRLSIASKGKGKSGGARVITYLITKQKLVYLLSVYDKSEMENLDKSKILELIKGLPNSGIK